MVKPAKMPLRRGLFLWDIGCHFVVGVDDNERLTRDRDKIAYWRVQAPFSNQTLLGARFIANMVRHKLVRYARDTRGRHMLLLTPRGYATAQAAMDRHTKRINRALSK